MNIPAQRPWLTTWGEVVASLYTLAPDDLVCFSGRPDRPDDPCLVIDGMQLDEDEDYPPEAEERGWTVVLGKETIQGVLSNLREQVDTPEMTLALRAIAYYVDNDAFITVT